MSNGNDVNEEDVYLQQQALQQPTEGDQVVAEAGGEEEIGEDSAMIVNTNKRNKSKASPTSSGRSIDVFLEDAYQEHSSSICGLICRQWQYWWIMVSFISCSLFAGIIRHCWPWCSK
jgi:hypothetical protein